MGFSLIDGHENALEFVKSPFCIHISYCILLTVVFPQDLLEKGLEADNFAMLGLGDIVIPGIFIALLLRFDHR